MKEEVGGGSIVIPLKMHLSKHPATIFEDQDRSEAKGPLSFVPMNRSYGRRPGNIVRRPNGCAIAFEAEITPGTPIFLDKCLGGRGPADPLAAIRAEDQDVSIFREEIVGKGVDRFQIASSVAVLECMQLLHDRRADRRRCISRLLEIRAARCL